MKWHLIYLIGPLCINGVYHPELTRLAAGVYCANCKEAEDIFNSMQKVESVDRIAVLPAVTREESDAAVRAMYNRDREQRQFVELMNAMMDTEPKGNGLA